MSNVYPLTLDSARNAQVEFFPRLPMLSSHQAAWNGLHLEYHRQPAHETPEFHLEQHLISIYVGDPGTNLMMNGNWQQESYQPGDIIILPAHQPLRTGWDREVEFIKLYLDPAVLSAQAGARAVRKCFEIAPQLKLRDPLIHQIGLALKLELESSDERKCLYVEAMTNVLAAHLLRRYSTCKSSSEETAYGLPAHKLNAITTYIHESIEQKLSLERLAEVVPMSPHYFASSFKQSTGYTHLQYVTECRIERAKQLIARRELEIVAIAQEVGFQNQSHFTRVFHKYTAVTPKTYRDAL